MVLAAVRMVSSRRWRSRSAESEAPIALSCSRRWPRSSAPVGAEPPAKRSPWVVSSILLNAHRAHFLDMGQAGEALLHPVLLQGAHAVLEALGEDVGDPGVLLDQLLQPVVRDEQLVQAHAALEAAVAALLAADRLVEGKLALVVAVDPDPLLVHRLHRALGIGLEAAGVHQLLAVLAQERGDLGGLGRVGLLAAAQAPAQALREDAEQRVGEVER